MDVSGQRGRLEGGHTTGQEGTDDAGQDVAGPRCGQPGVTGGGHVARWPSGDATTDAGPFSSTMAPLRAAAARVCGQPVGAGRVTSQTGELAVVRGYHRWRATAGPRWRAGPPGSLWR